jgi:hypothetical protein
MIDNIPDLIYSSTELFSWNSKLKNLRGELNTAISEVQSGAQAMKKVMGDLMERIFATIEELRILVEAAVIPKDSSDDFTNGLVTFDQFADFDMIEYYNGLNQLKLAFTGITAALRQISEVPQKALSPVPDSGSGDGILDTLSDTEYLEQGWENPVTEVETKFSYYEIIAGDTLQGIAAKVYNGDVTKWPEIADVNEISDSDLLDNALDGVVIKIPESGTGVARSDSNLVYEPFFKGDAQTDLNLFLHGSDLALDVNRNIAVDSQGDFKTIDGIKCVSENVQDRFLLGEGELNPLHPYYGVGITVDDSVPYMVRLEKILRDMEYQAMADPRVVSANVNRKSIEIKGDRFDVEITMSLIGGGIEKALVPIPKI